MIPFRVALALQADGWYVRSDIIWAKPNPMPESVTDRPTRSHEYIFLMSKSPKYFFDSEAVKEKRVGDNMFPGNKPNIVGPEGSSVSRRHPANASDRGDIRPWGSITGRNIRSVWNIPTRPYKEAHFATFPPKLIEPCIKPGTSQKGCCPECGKPWERVVEKSGATTIEERGYDTHQLAKGKGITNTSRSWKGGDVPVSAKTTIGWKPTCDHKKEPVPAIVLDPFSGAGTACLVSRELGRDYIGIELNPEYVEMAERRLKPIDIAMKSIEEFFD
jgi:DNA modification methylase